MKKLLQPLFAGLLLAAGFATGAGATDFGNVSVHDPSVIRTPEGMYYIIGSHMAGAKSPDLMRWTLLGSSPQDQPYFRNLTEELAEALAWGDTDTFWAGDYLRLPDGRYLMYYCVCQGYRPQALIGYAVADSPEGPFTDLGVLRRSAGYGQAYDPGDGTSITFDIENMPNCIDPNVFYDKEGRLWMVYGSYSGGIFILEMNPSDGSILPKEEQPAPVAENWPYGRRLAGGGKECFMEAPYILYSPETDYYYLFLSMGGLGQKDGYNLRVARSRYPYGPFLDEKGNDMVGARGSNSVMYQYGLKIMGNHRFFPGEGEAGTAGDYMSPGHNSAYYDPVTQRYFLIFHTRFSATGEFHEVRVHSMQMSDNGWPIVAPLRYAGEVYGRCDAEELAGTYQFLNLGTGESKEIIESAPLLLSPDGTVSGALSGRWSMIDDDAMGNGLKITVGRTVYKGRALYQYDEYTSSFKWTFSLADSRTNQMLWGVKTEAGRSPAEALPQDDGAGYLLMNARSGLYLTAAEEFDGAATLEDYGGEARTGQVFRLRAGDEEGTFRLVGYSGQEFSLGFQNNRSTAGTPIVNCEKEDYLGGSRKTFFQLEPTERGTYRLLKQGRASVCAAAEGGSLQSGAALVAAATSGSQEGQEWVLIRVREPEIADGVETVGAGASGAGEWQISAGGAELSAVLPGASSIRLCTASGAELASRSGGQAEFAAPGRGVYLLIGEMPDGRRRVAKVLL